jgi:glycosyltransferase involved in cell wall biosynthesis
MSVILPICNGESYVHECLVSIVNQHIDFVIEVIIVLNGCTDQTERILSEFLGKQEDNQKVTFRVINIAERNLILALDTGLQYAQSNIIARIDVDDVMINPYRLHKQFYYLYYNPDVNVVGCQAIIDRKNTDDVSEQPLGLASGLYTHPILVSWSMLFRCTVLHPTVAFRRNVIMSVGSYSSQVLQEI